MSVVGSGLHCILRAALLVGLLIGPALGQAPSKLVVYPYPRTVKYHPGDAVRDPYHNDDFTVRVRVPGGGWQDLYEHNVKVDWDNPQNATMVSFDFKGKVEVSIEKNNGNFSRVKIRPNSRGIKPVVKGESVTFSLDRPQNISVEFDGDKLHNLHIFAGDASIKDKRPADGPNVVYFGPGVHTPDNGAEAFTASSGQTIFIDGGAVLEGSFQLKGVHDVTIVGHGLIENPTTGFTIRDSQNIHIEGLTFVNPVHGTLACAQSQHVSISDIKSFSAGPWTDGVNVYSCEDVSLDKAFLRTSDDCFTVYAHRNDIYGDARHIRVSDSTLWADVAHTMFVGLHGNTDKPETIEDVVFKNIDVLGIDEAQPEYQGVMAISAGDSNLVRDITFEDIRVDYIEEGKLFNFRTVYNSKYNTSPGRGIENVILRHITYTGRGMPSASIIQGYDATRRVSHVIIDDVRINGKKLTKASPGLLQIGSYADVVTFH